MGAELIQLPLIEFIAAAAPIVVIPDEPSTDELKPAVLCGDTDDMPPTDMPMLFMLYVGVIGDILPPDMAELVIVVSGYSFCIIHLSIPSFIFVVELFVTTLGIFQLFCSHSRK
jgi:hypothetical protein